MFFLAQASASSGAPLADELRRLSDHYRSLELTAERERLERLPVKMLFPLAFLILPGFLLVAVVPAVAGGLAKLTL
jgi:pilus assembly protein TadC